MFLPTAQTKAADRFIFAREQNGGVIVVVRNFNMDTFNF